jgi:mono/diheme cytochrome c family protein
MKRSFFVMVGITVLSTVILAACAGGSTGTTAPEPPAEYKGKTNPLAGQADAATAGGQIFAERCASCHGSTGMGDGPAAASLDPKPADLAAAQKDLGDDVIFWRIMDGGAMAPFNSSMPAHKSILSEDQVWQLVTFIRTLN